MLEVICNNLRCVYFLFFIHLIYFIWSVFVLILFLCGFMFQSCFSESKHLQTHSSSVRASSGPGTWNSLDVPQKSLQNLLTVRLHALKNPESFITASRVSWSCSEETESTRTGSDPHVEQQNPLKMHPGNPSRALFSQEHLTHRRSF